MPTGIILKSASHEASEEERQKNLEAVVESAGFEVEKPAEALPEEPKREGFKTEEEFEAAHVEWEDAEAKKAEEAEEEAPPPAKKSRRTRAIERATAEKDQRIKELEAALAAAGKAPAGKEEEKKEEPQKAKRPVRTDFSDDEKYEDALLAWGVEDALAKKELKDAEAANKARFEENVRNYVAQIEEAKEKYDDWDDVVDQEIVIGREVQLAILEQENGAEVIYYLGRHPAYAEKLGKLSPLSAVMEVGRLSAKLLTGAPARGEANDEEEEPKPKPRVPAPVKTVRTGGSNATPTFAEIAARGNYPGKAKDLRRAEAAAKG